MKKHYTLFFACFCLVLSSVYAQQFSPNTAELDYNLTGPGVAPTPGHSNEQHRAPKNGLLQLDSTTAINLNGFYPSVKTVMSYAAQHLYDTVTVYLLRNGGWELRQKYVYTYDSALNLTQFLDYQNWDTTLNAWGVVIKEDYVYQNNLRISTLRQYQDDQTVGFENVHRYEYSYNPTGGLIETSYYTWAYNPNGELHSRLNDTLDAQNKVLSSTRRVYSNGTTVTSTARIDWQYDQYDLVVYGLSQVLGQSGWSPYFEYFYTNQNGLRMEEESWIYSFNGNYHPSSKGVYTYDSLANRTTEFYYSWSGTQNSLEPNSFVERFFDYSFEYADLNTGYNPEFTNHKLDSFIRNNLVSGVDYIEIYHWSPPLQTNTEPVFSAESPLLIYPNPATDYVSINLDDQATVELYAVTGQLMSRQTIEDGRLELNGLPAGCYIYRVLQKELQIKTGKLIVND